MLGYNSALPLINLLIHSNHEARTNIQDKTIKAKAKVAQLGEELSTNKLTLELLIAFAEKQRHTDKATCIEALEYATKRVPPLQTKDF